MAPPVPSNHQGIGQGCGLTCSLTGEGSLPSSRDGGSIQFLVGWWPESLRSCWPLAGGHPLFLPLWPSQSQKGKGREGVLVSWDYNLTQCNHARVVPTYPSPLPYSVN